MTCVPEARQRPERPSLWRQFPIVEAVLLLLSVGACFALTAGLIPS
jgi:hypothetical protein